MLRHAAPAFGLPRPLNLGVRRRSRLPILVYLTPEHEKAAIMRKTAVLLLSVSAFASAADAAQKWPSIGTFAMPGGGTATVFVDGGNGLTRHGDFWTARQKTLFSSPQRTSTGASFRSELDVYAYDCTVSRTALVSYTRYDGENLAGTVVEKLEHSSPSEYEWTTPTTGSVLERSRQIVCSLAALRSGGD